ncbi:hypothetical protein LUZ61_004993 [Rhynchospora tenuis]|uniref:F-box domain-containing protein n=1 Tax=Rhynchospora tenuis TaxID=198213 RepID=A0AAD5ZNV1_9POAL|nr:hypothetical protein LUZ61_004993 [Rhynchospora tenuis]
MMTYYFQMSEINRVSNGDPETRTWHQRMEIQGLGVSVAVESAMKGNKHLRWTLDWLNPLNTRQIRNRVSNRDQGSEESTLCVRWGRQAFGASVMVESALKTAPLRWKPDGLSLDVISWITIAEKLEARDVAMLRCTNKWFDSVVDLDHIWEKFFLKDMHIRSSRPVSFPWMKIYASAFNWKRIGAFFLDSPFVVLALIQALPDMPPMPGSDVQTSVNETGMCSLTNLRTGIWIAGRHLFGCPVHKPKTCTAMGQVLDARHVELFLEEDYRNGTWQYEDIFEKIIPGRANIAAMPAIIDPKIFLSPTKAWLLRVNSWDVKEHTIYTNRSSHGVAVCTYLPRNNGNWRYHLSSGESKPEMFLF